MRAVQMFADYESCPWQIVNEDIQDLTGGVLVDWYNLGTRGAVGSGMVGSLCDWVEAWRFRIDATVNASLPGDPDLVGIFERESGTAYNDNETDNPLSLNFPGGFSGVLVQDDPPTYTPVLNASLLWIGSEVSVLLGYDDLNYYIKLPGGGFSITNLYLTTDPHSPFFDGTHGIYTNGYTTRQIDAEANAGTTDPPSGAPDWTLGGGSWGAITPSDGYFRITSDHGTFEIPMYWYEGPNSGEGGNKASPKKCKVLIAPPATGSYYEYSSSPGVDPVWDRDTGEQLITPVPTSMP